MMQCTNPACLKSFTDARVCPHCGKYYPPPRMFHHEIICDVILTRCDRSMANMPAIVATLRILKRREHERYGVASVNITREHLRIAEMLEDLPCVVARGEKESVAMLACRQLERAGAEAAVRMRRWASPAFMDG